MEMYLGKKEQAKQIQECRGKENEVRTGKIKVKSVEKPATKGACQPKYLKIDRAGK